MTATARRILPHRRHCETLELSHAGQTFSVSIGYYDRDLTGPGAPGEVFITGPKAGSDVEAVARDGAVILSIAMQFGVPLDVISGAITRGLDGVPMTIIGAVVDQLAKG